MQSGMGYPLIRFPQMTYPAMHHPGMEYPGMFGMAGFPFLEPESPDSPDPTPAPVTKTDVKSSIAPIISTPTPYINDIRRQSKQKILSPDKSFTNSHDVTRLTTKIKNNAESKLKQSEKKSDGVIFYGVSVPPTINIARRNNPNADPNKKLLLKANVYDQKVAHNSPVSSAQYIQNNSKNAVKDHTSGMETELVHLLQRVVDILELRFPRNPQPISPPPPPPTREVLPPYDAVNRKVSSLHTSGESAASNLIYTRREKFSYDTTSASNPTPTELTTEEVEYEAEDGVTLPTSTDPPSTSMSPMLPAALPHGYIIDYLLDRSYSMRNNKSKDNWDLVINTLLANELLNNRVVHNVKSTTAKDGTHYPLSSKDLIFLTMLPSSVSNAMSHIYSVPESILLFDWPMDLASYINKVSILSDKQIAELIDPVGHLMAATDRGQLDWKNDFDYFYKYFYNNAGDTNSAAVPNKNLGTKKVV